MCRRFLADPDDFSVEKLQGSDIDNNSFINETLIQVETILQKS